VVTEDIIVNFADDKIRDIFAQDDGVGVLRKVTDELIAFHLQLDNLEVTHSETHGDFPCSRLPY
jgi:hypothetical protein